ncbi:TetR/AcrR family transcriptional regulator [Pelobium manganitolerans]|uniref:TetR/AcrR family transcriptional regulator n=1 Tax=Pelobium manganitolerans TaxID=1842495 RepID=UPI003FA3AEAB
MEQQDQKREQILEAALKRFAHFGLSKTTMNDIAGDLNFSKALLYYYFPDKLSLYAAVLEKVFAEINSATAQALKGATTPEQAVKVYANGRVTFLEKYFPLLDFNKFLNIDKYEDLKKILEAANEAEVQHLKSIMEIGVKAKQYHIDDIDHTARLLFDVIQGIRVLHITNAQVQFGIDKKFLNVISDRQQEIVSVFLRGLRC